MSKIIASTWYPQTDGSVVGIVEVEDEVLKQRKLYIGTGKGINKDEDEKHIAAFGCKFNPNDFIRKEQ